ncbi:MAG: LysR family transcriptional regulator [Pseudomonas sp.]
MEQLKRMAVFATVVDKGSMVAAAAELGMTPSAVSQQISKLEASTQVNLLHRTTRKLTLTEAGATFYRSCAQVLALAQDAEQRLLELRDAPVGELRITVPVGFASGRLSRALAPLLAAHRQLRLNVFFDDEQIDLIEQRIDIALRIGRLENSSLVARHVADWNAVLCAAPAYLAQHPPIETPEQLQQIDWLSLKPQTLVLHNGAGEERRVKLESRITCNNMIAAREFTLAGLGVSVQAEPEVRAELASGRLQRVLPGWQHAAMPLYLVTPRRDAQPAKVRYAMEALKQNLQRG